MSVLQPVHGIDLIREQIEAFNHGNWEGVARLFTPNAIYEEMALGLTLRGPDNIVTGLELWRNTYPDLVGTITRYIGDDQAMAIELVWEGTFTNDLVTPKGVIKATGTHDRVFAAQFYTFEEGRISALHHYFDLATATR